MKSFENNGVEIVVGDFLRMSEYDTLVGGGVYLCILQQDQDLIKDKGFFFEMSLASQRKDLIVDIVVKLDKEEEFDTLSELEEFIDTNSYAKDNRSFWDLEVEVLKIEEVKKHS